MESTDICSSFNHDSPELRTVEMNEQMDSKLVYPSHEIDFTADKIPAARQ